MQVLKWDFALMPVGGKLYRSFLLVLSMILCRCIRMKKTLKKSYVCCHQRPAIVVLVILVAHVRLVVIIVLVVHVVLVFRVLLVNC